MSLRQFYKSATKWTRCFRITTRQQFKTVRTGNGNIANSRNSHHVQAKSRLTGHLTSFISSIKCSKHSLTFCLGVGIIGTFSYSLLSYHVQTLPLSHLIDFETISNTIVKPIHAKWFLSKHNFIADVVDKTGPAVVYVEVKGQHPDSGNRITLSNGSGFLVRPNGIILTSAHVVTNKSNVLVKLHNGDVHKGLVTAIDPVYDLATVKIETGIDLPVIPLESSANIRPGEFVIAMGSPLSLSKTVTSGIISSSLRASKEIGLENSNMQYIQTDAVINAGNSGGPLVNLDGKAIGINNLKIKNGISFAIPADYAFEFLNEAERIMEKAINNKRSKPSYIANGRESRTKRRFMGITMLSLTPSLIDELQVGRASFPPVDHGVFVHTVIVGSPAYDGGLHAGDIITEINGKTINSTADVYTCVEKDTRLKIKILRGRKYNRVIEVVTEELF